MKICYLNHDLKHSTGAGRFGLNLIERVRRSDPQNEVSVLTSVASGHEFEKAILSQSGLGLLFALPRIRAVLKQCDIIHALDGFPYGVVAALASVGLGKKLIITAIGTGAIQPLRHPVKGTLLRWAYRKACRVIAVSHYTRREILAKVGDVRIEVINHAINVLDFEKNRHMELSAEERSTIEKLKPYMISVGSWKKRKGFEYSFPAFQRIARQFPRLNYAVVGINYTPPIAESLGVSDKVFCFYNVRWPFLKELYKNAELFMLLPRDDRGDVEGFGFVFLEAAAAGLPVIGTTQSGAEDAVLDGQNGFLVSPENSDEAAAAAVKILSQETLRKKFSSVSLAFARRMNWENVVRRYSEIYKDAAVFQKAQSARS